MAAGGSAPTRLRAGQAARPAARQTGLPAGGNHRPSHANAQRAQRPDPSPAPPLVADPRPLPSQPAPPSLSHSSNHSPRPPSPSPDLRRRPPDGFERSPTWLPPTPSALLVGSGRPLTRRARARALAKNSQARLYLVRPDPSAAARTAPRCAPPGAPHRAPPRPAQR